nr:AraC family transcriptional regulator [Paenibacillus psychroresistens]
MATSVAYYDAYYFSRLFKKHTGYPPSQLRLNNKKLI